MNGNGNFFTENEDITDFFEHMDIRRVVAMQERGYAEAEQFDYAPVDYEDAIDSYRRVLEVVGELAARFIEPRASEVDQEGVCLVNGRVRYAKGTRQNLEQLAKADLMGFTLPRKYGGLNLPMVIYSMAIEIVSRADASLMNIFGLQDIAETINSFASEELKDRYLPRFCSGEVTGAMALTEPDAGSDRCCWCWRAVRRTWRGPEVCRCFCVRRTRPSRCGASKTNWASTARPRASFSSTTAPPILSGSASEGSHGMCWS